MANGNDEGLGGALRFVDELSQEATGNFVIEVAEPPRGAVGLPEKVPYLQRLGKHAQTTSLKPLLDEWRTAPERRKGTATVQTLHAFVGLTARHSDEHSVLFAQTDWPNPSLTAVINYHQSDGVARFGDHRIVYPFPLTREFSTWVEKNGRSFGQAEFAEFIEENIATLSLPLDAERAEFEEKFRSRFAVPTDLVSLARGLEINVGAKVKNAFRMESGEAEIRFEVEHRAASGEPLHVPGLFMLSCRAFVDGSEVRLPARLRYRVHEGAIIWSYHLYRWEDALRERIASDLAIVATQTGLPAFEGAPEK